MDSTGEHLTRLLTGARSGGGAHLEENIDCVFSMPKPNNSHPEKYQFAFPFMWMWEKPQLNTNTINQNTC